MFSGADIPLKDADRDQLTIRIGKVPLRLYGERGALFEKAAARYGEFQSREQDGLPVIVGNAPPNETIPSFQYQLNSSNIQIRDTSAHFSGVQTEYEMDSLLRILLSNLLLEQSGFLLHAATMIRDEKTFVFMGRSGAGKSTVASLSPAGSVLTDEISLVRTDGAHWKAYGTPFWGEFRAEGQNRSAPLAGIYALVQSDRNLSRRLEPKRALAALLGNTLFFSTTRGARERLLEILSAMVAAVPVYEMEFLKDSSFWEAAA